MDRPVCGRELLLAVIAGFETGPRIGYALGGTEMLSRGWHSGPIFGGIAAALACGILRGLTGAELEDAVGFAATQSAGLMSAQYEAMGKRMQHGFAARNGFYSAALATPVTPASTRFWSVPTADSWPSTAKATTPMRRRSLAGWGRTGRPPSSW